MELGHDIPEALDLSVDERNGKLLALENKIVTTPPDFEVGDKVKANGVGIAAGIMEAGELFIVVDKGDHLPKYCGDPFGNLALWTFASDGSLRRMIVNDRMVDMYKKHIPSKKKKK